MNKLVKCIVCLLLCGTYFQTNVFSYDEDESAIQDINRNEYVTEVLTSNENKKVTSVKTDDYEIIVINDYENELVIFEHYEEDVLIKRKTIDVKQPRKATYNKLLKANDYELNETDSGWGYYFPKNLDFNAFNCSEELVDEGHVDSSYIEVKKNKPTTTVKVFRDDVLTLKDYESDLDLAYSSRDYHLIITILAGACAFYFGDPTAAAISTSAALDAISLTGEIEILIEDMAYTIDNLGHWYLELYRLSD